MVHEIFFAQDEEYSEIVDRDETGNDEDDLNLPELTNIGQYFKDIRQTPLLTAEEEVVLAQQMELGRNARRFLEQPNLQEPDRYQLELLVDQGSAARGHLIRANTRWVAKIAKHYQKRGVPFLDLVQEGNLGLMKALEKFDYRRGYRLSTYATWWIRQTILLAIADQARTIRIPMRMLRNISKLLRTQHQLEQKLGREPDNHELAQAMGVTEERIEFLVEKGDMPISLELLAEGRDDPDYDEFIENTNAINANTQTEEDQQIEQLEEALNSLPQRDAEILRYRFGFINDHTYTLRELSKIYHVTYECIRKIENRTLRKLRETNLLYHPVNSDNQNE